MNAVNIVPRPRIIVLIMGRHTIVRRLRIIVLIIGRLRIIVLMMGRHTMSSPSFA